MSPCLISIGSEDSWCDFLCENNKQARWHQAYRRVCVVVAVCVERGVHTSTVIMHHGEHVTIGVECIVLLMFVVMRRRTQNCR